MNDLSKVFTKNNMDILRLLKTEDNLHIREIAEKTKASPATVHSAVKLFRGLGMVIEKRVKNRKIVSLNRDSLLLNRINALMNFHEINKFREFRKLQRYGKVGVYGSFASGKDLPESDVDLWIYSNKKLNTAELKGITRELERYFGKEVKLIVLNDEKIKSLKDNDPEFYFRLKLTSVGEDVFG